MEKEGVVVGNGYTGAGMVSGVPILFYFLISMVVNKCSLYNHLLNYIYVYKMIGSQVHMYVKIYQIFHFKYVQHITFKLHLNNAFKNSSIKKKSTCPTLSWKTDLATLY